MYSRTLWLFLLMLASLGLFTGVSTEVGTPMTLPPPAAETLPGALPGAQPDPEAYARFAGWREFANAELRFLYPGGWWILLDDGPHAAVRSQAAYFRVDLHDLPPALAGQIAAGGIAAGDATLIGPILRQHAEARIRAIMQRAGVGAVRLTALPYSTVGSSPTVYDLAYVVEPQPSGARAPFGYIVVPYALCVPDHLCSVLYSSPLVGTESPEPWIELDQLMRTLKVSALP